MEGSKYLCTIYDHQEKHGAIIIYSNDGSALWESAVAYTLYRFVSSLSCSDKVVILMELHEGLHISATVTSYFEYSLS